MNSTFKIILGLYLLVYSCFHIHIPNTVAAVVTVDASMPTVSIELASGINPYRDTRPYVGLTPTVPQKEAGSRTEPPVSVPRAL